MDFTKNKTTDLDNQTRVYFSIKGTEDFSIVVEKLGIRFVGTSPIITEMQDLEDFAKIVSHAWAEHKRMQPDLMVGVHLGVLQ